MEEDEDDFYGGAGGSMQDAESSFKQEAEESKMEINEESEEEGEESDDDVQFTLEKPEGAKSEPAQGSKQTRQTPAANESTAASDPRTTHSGTPLKREQTSGSVPSPSAIKGTLTHNGREGKSFPGIHSSKVDVNGTPIWPANDKPITEVDLDADLAENSKPWRLPGTDQTDFFNYGFDEYSWAQYCLRQQNMTGVISAQKQEDAQMKAMFGGADAGAGQGGGPGGGPSGGANMPPGMPQMPGMPSPEEMMQMMSQGIGPDQMFQMMMGGGGMPGMPGGQGQQGGGGFGGVAGQDGGSPHPQAGQGFQPPQGPQQGDQGGFGANMEGYSPQQIAIMQQQHGGGGRRGNRGGRRFY